jgi:acyl dehydratase
MTARTPGTAHEELRACIGAQGPELHGTIDARDIARYAAASGETSPIYTDEAAARAAGFDGLPTPPVMLASVIEWGAGPALGELRPDGTGVGRESWLPLDGLRLMGGGQDLILHRPVLAGTEFVAQPRLESVELKEGGSGAMLLLTITTEFRSVGGADLVTCRETVIAR